MGKRSGHKSSVRRARESGQEVVGLVPAGSRADGLVAYVAVTTPEGRHEVDPTDPEALEFLAGSYLEAEVAYLEARRSLVVAARMQGKSWRETGALIGVSAQTALRTYGADDIPASSSSGVSAPVALA